MLFFIGLVGLIVTIVGMVKVIKKDPDKKKTKWFILIGIVLFILGITGAKLLSEPPEVNTSKSSSVIDKNGTASLVVTTDKAAQVKIKDVDASAYDTDYKPADSQGVLRLTVDHSGKYKVIVKNKYDSATKTINIKTSPYEQAPRKVEQLFKGNSKNKLIPGTTMNDINDVKADISDLSKGKVKTWCLKYLNRAKKLQPALAKKEAAAAQKQEKAESESVEKAASESKAESESIAKIVSESSVKQAAADSSSTASSIAASQSNVAAAAIESSAPTDQTQQIVYIAPTSGTKYHFDPNCRGLRNANGNIQSMSLSDAESRNYTKCGFE